MARVGGYHAKNCTDPHNDHNGPCPKPAGARRYRTRSISMTAATYAALVAVAKDRGVTIAEIVRQALGPDFTTYRRDNGDAS